MVFSFEKEPARMIAIPFLVLGLAAGVLYFASLWWTSQALAVSGLTAGTAALVICRMALLACVLFLVSRQGAMPLLMMALGIFAGRAIVMRSTRVAS